MLLTRGFRTPILLRRHARLHSQEVNAADEADYLALADAFLGGAMRSTTHECVRQSDNAVIRWDDSTQEYGVLAADGFIHTYFILDPRWHTFPSNRAYFRHDCGR